MQTRWFRNRSKFITDVELEFAARAVVLIRLDGDTVVDAQWSDGKVQPQTNARVGHEVVGAIEDVGPKTKPPGAISQTPPLARSALTLITAGSAE